MNRLSGLFCTLMMWMGFGLIFTGCREEPFIIQSPENEHEPFVAETISADGITIPQYDSSTVISVNPVFEVSFNYDVDPATVVPSNFLLLQDYDKKAMAVDVHLNGNKIGILPSGKLCSGALYKLSISSGIKTIGGMPLHPATCLFTTAGTFVPLGTVAYWNFENNALDQGGIYNPAPGGMVDITYTPSRKSSAGKAATFDGDRSIIEIENAEDLINTRDFTLCFWVRTNSTCHWDANGNPSGYFVMGLGSFYGFQFEISSDFGSCNFVGSYETVTGQTSGIDLKYYGDGKTRNNGGWQGCTFCRDLHDRGGVAALLKDKWAHIVCIYTSETKVGGLFINGSKMMEQDFNLWNARDTPRNITGLKYSGQEPFVKDELAFGFLHSRSGTLMDDEPRYSYNFSTSDHFKGQLDDVRIFHEALTENEIRLMYDSEK